MKVITGHSSFEKGGVGELQEDTSTAAATDGGGSLAVPLHHVWGGWGPGDGGTAGQPRA